MTRCPDLAIFVLTDRQIDGKNRLLYPLVHVHGVTMPVGMDFLVSSVEEQIISEADCINVTPKTKL